MGNTVGSYWVGKYRQADQAKLEGTFKPLTALSRNMKRVLENWEPKTNTTKKTKNKQRGTYGRKCLPSGKPRVRRESQLVRSQTAFKNGKHVGKKSSKAALLKKSKSTRRVPTTDKDANDPLINSFNVQPRNSSSKRCLEWVQNLPHSSSWDTHHTLSGTDISRTKEQTKQQRRNIAKRTSQRKLLMQKIMDDKFKKLDSAKKKASKRLARKDSMLCSQLNISSGELDLKGKRGLGKTNFSKKQKRNVDEEFELDKSVAVPKKKKKVSKRKTPKAKPEYSETESSSQDTSYDDESSSFATESENPSVNPDAKIVVPSSKNHKASEPRVESDDNASVGTSTLQGRAEDIVKRMFSETDVCSVRESGKQIAALCCQTLKSSKSQSNNKTKYADSKSYQSGSSCDSSLSDDTQSCASSLTQRGKHYAKQTHCLKAIQKRKVNLKKQKRRGQLKKRLEESCKSKPRTRDATDRIYARKHRAGLYLSRERQKVSLGWAILQSVKLLQQKAIPYPLAILNIMQQHWQFRDLTLVQLKQALRSMESKGVLKSTTIRDNDRVFTVFRRNDKPKRAQKRPSQHQGFSRSKSSVKCGIPIKKRKGPMRVRFQHGEKDFTSVKCKRNGSHYLDCKKPRQKR